MKVSHVVALLSSSAVVLALPGWIPGSTSLVSRGDDDSNQKNGTDDSLTSSGRDHPEDDTLGGNGQPQVTPTRPEVSTDRRGHWHGWCRGRGRGRKGKGKGKGKGRGKGRWRWKHHFCHDEDDPAVATSTPYASPFGLIGNGTFFGNGTSAGNATALDDAITATLTSDDAATDTATLTDDSGGDVPTASGI